MEGIEYKKDEELTITSDMTIFDISYRKTKEYLQDIDAYVNFVKACEKMVRKHPDYNNFVGQIRDICPNCQVLGNIHKEDAVLEMHHNFLTLFDYCAIVTNWFLSKGETVNTFKVANVVLQEHFDEHVQVVMLSKSVHQSVDTGEAFINLKQGIGNIGEFFKKYKEGLSPYYIEKIKAYIELSKEYQSHDSGIFDLEENMVNWSYASLPDSIKDRF